MTINKNGIRKPWAALLAVYVLLFLFGLYPYLRMFGSINPIQLTVAFLDAVAIYGLFGFVMRNPIRSMTMRIIFLSLIPLLLIRLSAGAYFILPSVFPWIGFKQQYVSVFAVLGVLLGLPLVFALWQYTTKAQVTK
jgi:hypothetical protein